MSTDPWIRFATEAPLENYEVFLSAKGFVLVDTLGNRGSVYQIPGGANVLLPHSNDYDDYSIRITDLVDDLAQILREDRDSISRLISSVGYDSLKIRTGIGKQSFSVDLDDAIDVLNNGYSIVDYSAVYAAAKTPPAYVMGRRTKEVSAYLDTVRMGQTEPGSFILTLLLPVLRHRDLVGTSPALDLGQRVSDAVVNGLKTSKAALRGPGGLRAKGRPVTGNFLAALADIVSRSPTVEIAMDQRTDNATHSVKFARSDEEPLRELAEELTPKVRSWDTTVSGTVINLFEARGQRDGYFILEAPFDDGVKNIKVGFARDERKDVIRAFDEKAEFKLDVHGRVVKSYSGRYSIERASSMRLNRRGSLT